MTARIYAFPTKLTAIGTPQFDAPSSPRVTGGQSKPAPSLEPDGLEAFWPELKMPAETEMRAWFGIPLLDP